MIGFCPTQWPAQQGTGLVVGAANDKASIVPSAQIACKSSQTGIQRPQALVDPPRHQFQKKNLGRHSSAIFNLKSF